MAACDAGKKCLFVRSVLHDLGVPQEEASILYVDKEGTIGMENTQKPTTCNLHMDITVGTSQLFIGLSAISWYCTGIHRYLEKKKK